LVFFRTTSILPTSPGLFAYSPLFRSTTAHILALTTTFLADTHDIFAEHIHSCYFTRYSCAFTSYSCDYCSLSCGTSHFSCGYTGSFCSGHPFLLVHPVFLRIHSILLR